MPSKIFDRETGVNIIFSENFTASADIWLIHGFTDSSDSLTGIFNTYIPSEFTVYIPDLPGFGQSQFNDNCLDLRHVVALLKRLIEKYSSGRPLIILGHSLGGTLATLLIPELKNSQLLTFFNVEGMLLEDRNDQRSLTKAAEFKDSREFVDYMLLRLSGAAKINRYVQRYLDNISTADPAIIHAWAMSSTEILSNNKIDQLYKQLPCDTLYVYGEKTMSKLELNYLSTVNYDRMMISKSGHWPMLENPREFWHAISERLLLLENKHKIN